MAEIQEKVRDFIIEEFLPGEDPEELEPDTPLMTGGILDSIATLKLVAFLEESFDIRLEAHETDSENLDTLEVIETLVQSKLG